MLLKSLLGLSLLSTTTIASPLKPRDIITAETLITDIGSIDNGVQSLTSSLQSYTGDLISETSIAIDITSIHLSNRKSYLDAILRSTPFSAEDSTAIVDFTAKSVGVDIPASVEVLKSKYDLLEGQKDVILAGLVLLKNDHDSFSEALVGKLTADLVEGNAAVTKIDVALQSGIDLYSS